MLRNNTVKQLNTIAIPLIIQSISSLIISFTDQALVGRISIYAFSSIGVITTLLSFIAGILGFISVSFNIRASKLIGKNNLEEFKDEFISSLLLNTFIGLIFVVLIIFSAKQILVIFYNFSGTILSEALKYFNIMSLYILIQLLLFNFSAYFKVIKNTKYILISSLSASILNILLDYIFIFGKLGFPQLGVTGAAMASIISLLLNLLIYILIAKKDIVLNISKFKKYWYIIKQELIDSIPLMGQELLEGSIFVIFINAILARIGLIELTSYLLVSQFISIILMPMYMYGSATLTLVSENSEQTDFKLLKLIPKYSIKLSITIYILLSFILILFKNQVPKLITDNNSVINYSSNILVILLLINLLNPIQTIYKYALQAYSDSTFVLYSTAFINFVSLIVMSTLVFIFKVNINGLFIGFLRNYILLIYVYIKRYNKLIYKANYITTL